MSSLQPGQVIRAQTSLQMIHELLKKLYGLTDVKVTELKGYDDRNYRIRLCDNDRAHLWPHGYILKIINSLDSQNPLLIEAQTEIALYLDKAGITNPKPVKNNNGEFYSLEDVSRNGSESKKHIVRMLTFYPGITLNLVHCSSNLFYKLGRFTARLTLALKGFSHPAYSILEKTIWSLECVLKIKKFIFAIKDDKRKIFINEVLQKFEEEVLPISDNLERGMIHGDLNDQNIVMSPDPVDGSWEVSALLDMGDTQHSCYVYELAVHICYMTLIAKDMDPLDAGGHVIAGYNTLRLLPEMELNILRLCICARLCQSLVMGAHSYINEPENGEYLLNTAKKGWGVLELLWKTANNELIQRWKKIVDTYNETNK